MADAPTRATGRPDSRQVEQLRWLVRRDFDPPLRTAQLVEALGASGENIQVAYHLLKNRRRRAESERGHAAAQAAASMSQPATTAPAVAKRRVELLEASDASAKRPKSAREDAGSDRVAPQTSQAPQDLERDGVTPEAARSAQQPTSLQAVDEARRVLEATVSARAWREQRGDPEWATTMMKALQVQPLLEVVLPMNLAADALAVWSKKETDQGAVARQRTALDEIVAAVALVPRQEADTERTRPIAEVVAKHEEEMEKLRGEALEQQQPPLRLRAMTAQRLIEAVSGALKVHFDRLEQLAGGGGSNTADVSAGGPAALEELEQSAVRRADESAAEVQAAEAALRAAKNVMDSRATVLVAFINERAEAFKRAGESDDGAKWKAAVEVTLSDDDEIAAFRASREDSEQRVASCADMLEKRAARLAFDQSLVSLIRAVKAERKHHGEAAHHRFQQAQAEMQERTANFVERHLATLTDALQLYFEFRAVQEDAARGDEEDQAKALKEVVNLYGDSAPLKLRDLELRIAEFKSIRTLALEGIANMVKSQQELWTSSRGLLSKKTWKLVASAYKDLRHRQSQVVQSAMLELVSAVDMQQGKASDGGAAGSSQVQAEAPTDAVVGSYRTAVSPVLAVDTVSASTGASERGLASPPAQAAPIVNEASAAVPVKLNQVHEFALGAEVFTKFVVADDCSQHFRGKIVDLLADGSYRVQYDDGDVFSVERQYLFTQDEVAHETSAESASGQPSAESSSDASGCAVM